MKRLTGVVASIGMVLLISACGRSYLNCPVGWSPMMGSNYFGHGGMFMGMIFILLLIVAAIYWFAREAKYNSKGTAGETAIDILKKRYAGGEITKDEFERMKKDLGA